MLHVYWECMTTSSLYYYFAYGSNANYGDQRAFLSICLSVRLHILKTTRPNFTKFYVHVTRGRGSVLF